MSEYVTFVGRDDNGTDLDVVSVTVLDTNNVIALQDQFSAGQPGVGPNIVVLPAGTYKVSCRSDGYKFPYNQTIEIHEGSGPSYESPLTILLVGTTSARGLTIQEKVLVYGWIDLPSANSAAGLPLQSHGQSYSDGPNLYSVTVSPSVWFESVSSSSAGELRTLRQKTRTRVVPDRNGYFEAYLDPNSVYRVSVPTVHGIRYLITPPSGEADVEDLIDAAMSTPLYELV